MSARTTPAAPETRRATIRDVADAAGVSKSLVSLAFKDPARVSEERLSRIRDAAERLGYQRNFLAMSLAGQGVPFVAILVVDLHNPLFTDITDAVRAELERNGQYGLVTSAALPGRGAGPTGYGSIDERVVAMLTDLRPRAIVIVGSAPQDAPFDGIPKVYASAVAGPAATSVRMDDQRGLDLLVGHLSERGHRRIAFVGGDPGPVADAREGAYVAAMTARNLTPEVHPGGFSEEAGLEAGRDLLSRPERPDAIVAVNDLAAIGVLTAADQAGLTVPGDVAVTGIDNTSLSGLHRIGLTTLDADSRELGRRAARAALARVADPDLAPQEHLILPRLVVRAST